MRRLGITPTLADAPMPRLAVTAGCAASNAPQLRGAAGFLCKPRAAKNTLACGERSFASPLASAHRDERVDRGGELDRPAGTDGSGRGSESEEEVVGGASWGSPASVRRAAPRPTADRRRPRRPGMGGSSTSIGSAVDGLVPKDMGEPTGGPSPASPGERMVSQWFLFFVRSSESECEHTAQRAAALFFIKKPIEKIGHGHGPRPPPLVPGGRPGPPGPSPGRARCAGCGVIKRVFPGRTRRTCRHPSLSLNPSIHPSQNPSSRVGDAAGRAHADATGRCGHPTRRTGAWRCCRAR